MARSDIRMAADLAEAAIAAGESDTMLFNLAAWSREEAGDFAAAHILLERALALSPGDPLIIAAIGAALRREDKLAEAIRRLDEALAINPDLAVAWLERGFALDAGGSFKRADHSYRQAARCDPSLAEAFSGIASIAVRDGDADLGRQCAGRALALKPGEPTATLVNIALDVEDGHIVDVAPRLEAYLARTDLKPAKRISALTWLGDTLGKQRAPEAAFAAYSEAQHIYADLYAPRFGPGNGHPTYRDAVVRIDARVAGIDDTRDWALSTSQGAADPNATGHVFLLGFPRSGTTLVENILASAPGVVALEERATLAHCNRAFLETDQGFDDLVALDSRGAAPFRDDYWRKVAASGANVAGKLFVDMDPLKGLQLPVIARLFPDARIAFMQRDPRDVVWSCFRRTFRVSPATYQLASLEGAARLYDAMMRLIERCVERLPIHVHRLRYGDLVSDFDATTQALCGFVGIDWTPAMRAFSDTARKRGVGTASVMQVRKGLFDGGNQWRPFEAQMAPVLPLLEPWVEKFGFAA